MTPVFTIYSRPESRDRWWVALGWHEIGGEITIGEAKTLEEARGFLPMPEHLTLVFAPPDDELGRDRVTREIWKPAQP